jgi:hypothetical protein
VDRQKLPVRWWIGRRFQLAGGQERIPATGLAPEIPPDSVHVHPCQSGLARSATTGPRAAGWGRISGSGGSVSVRMPCGEIAHSSSDWLGSAGTS